MSDLSKVAASGVTRKIGDETYEFIPLDLRDFGAIHRQAFEFWRDNQIGLYRKYYDTFPENERAAVFRAVLDEAARMDVTDLPPKEYMLNKDGAVTNDPAEKVDVEKVDYAQWWMTHTTEGRIHCIWASLRKARPAMTYDECEKLVLCQGGNLVKSSEFFANLVGEISGPTLLGVSNEELEETQDDNGKPVQKKRKTRSTKE